MKRTIVAVLVLALCLPVLAWAETAEDAGMERVQLEDFGISLEVPVGWISLDGKTAYNTESVDFMGQNFPIAAHMIFTDDAMESLVHVFKVPAEVLAGGDELVASLEAYAGENGEWVEINGLQFFVFVDVEQSLCCAMAITETGIVILAAQPIEDEAFVAVFDEMLSSAQLLDAAP